MTGLILLPDIGQLVYTFLSTHPAVVALVDDRVYGNTPADTAKTAQPFVRITQFDSLSPTRGWLTAGIFQIDAYGGPQAMASLIARTVDAALLQLPGTHDEGIVTAVDNAGIHYNPDVTAGPASSRENPGARPKYQFVSTIHAHPNTAVGS